MSQVKAEDAVKIFSELDKSEADKAWELIKQIYKQKNLSKYAKDFETTGKTKKDFKISKLQQSGVLPPDDILEEMEEEFRLIEEGLSDGADMDMEEYLDDFRKEIEAIEKMGMDKWRKEVKRLSRFDI